MLPVVRSSGFKNFAHDFNYQNNFQNLWSLMDHLDQGDQAIKLKILGAEKCEIIGYHLIYQIAVVIWDY